jgi:21S rRNA (GM2251-2'-O)-methyltransferase
VAVNQNFLFSPSRIIAMNHTILSRSLRNSKTGSIILPLLYPALRTTRAASLNSAIHHGIRRSKGVGFRGKERSRSQDGGQSYGRKDVAHRRSAETSGGSGYRGKMRTVGSEGKPGSFSLGSRYPDAESIFGKNEFGKERKLAAGGSRGNAKGGVKGFAEKRNTRSLGRPTARSPRENEDYTEENAGSSGRGKGKYPSLSSRKPKYDSPSRVSHNKDWSHSTENSSKQYGSPERSFGSKDDENTSRQFGSQGRGLNPEERGPRFRATNKKRDDESASQSRIDTRIPVSIPYTTPASEFLYGTSVVEAALSSRRVPRRKHYKLYIYNGDNREGSSVQRDAGLERLAKKNGVDVVRVSGDWLRVMDKMSGGRPHNGYILEASPLPRKPTTSLGEFITTDGQTGFQVNMDHQSREEAAVNGTDDFIQYFSTIPGRKPLVLLLDSIVDPGNLGGIIRTASFLGVTAIAVSTRNSASFTSVVLKASAGASENATLFSVNKPAGFLVDSKAAGWKVYAAVAPSGRQDPDVPESLSTDQLDDPLSENPCILMLGGEGEGLRWNLRSKADVDLSIRGGGRSHNVDSLNVSVAAGILCSSFLSKSNRKKTPDGFEEARVGEEGQFSGDLF